MAHGLQNALLAWSTLLLVQAKNWDVFYADAVPQDRSGFSFVLHNQRVWYFGGYPMTITVESQLTRFNDLYCFETGKPENWAHVIAEGTPPAMAGHSAIVDKSGRMWIFGGSTGSGLLYDIYHINLADAKCEPGNSGKWTKVSTKNPPAARSSHSAVYHGGRMWVFGGWLGGDAPYSNEHTLSADAHYLDLEASTWSVVEPHGWKPMARYAHQALMGADGRMWIYGGYNINGTAKEGVAMVALDRLYCFDTDKRIWSALTAAGSAPNYLGYPFVAMDAAGRMWMGGGFISSTEVNANLFYLDTLSTDLQWKEVEDFKSDVDGPPLNRIGAEAVMEANGNMWIVGGMTELRQQLPLCRLATAVQAPTTATTTTTPRPDPGTYIWIILLVVLLCIIILGGLLFLRKRRNLKLLQERQDPQQVEMGEARRA